MKCLFIGGCADGEWRDVDSGQIEIRVQNKEKWNPHAMLNTTESVVTYHSYRRETFSEGDAEYAVYVSGIQPGKMFEALLNGYSRKK